MKKKGNIRRPRMSIMVKEVLQMAEAALEKAGCMDPRLDAERLFQYQYNLDNTGLFLMKPKMIDQKEFEKYFELVDFRLAGMPLQYITGSQEFMGLEFKVNENVLIPRQDTETLVEKALEYITGNRQNVRQKNKGELKILDLCCGSGAVGISLAHFAEASGRKVKVTEADISEKALLVAKENAKALKVDKNMEFECGDLFKPFKKRFSKKKFNIIVTNPPYIKTQTISELQREVKDHEPRLALDGGADGLEFYREIISDAKDYLESGGVLIMEIGHDQGEDIKKIYEKSWQYIGFEIIKDLAGNDRVVVIYH